VVVIVLQGRGEKKFNCFVTNDYRFRIGSKLLFQVFLQQENVTYSVTLVSNSRVYVLPDKNLKPNIFGGGQHST